MRELSFMVLSYESLFAMACLTTEKISRVKEKHDISAQCDLYKKVFIPSRFLVQVLNYRLFVSYRLFQFDFPASYTIYTKLHFLIIVNTLCHQYFFIFIYSKKLLEMDLTPIRRVDEL